MGGNCLSLGTKPLFFGHFDSCEDSFHPFVVSFLLLSRPGIPNNNIWNPDLSRDKRNGVSLGKLDDSSDGSPNSFCPRRFLSDSLR